MRFIREGLAVNAYGREGMEETWSCDAVSAEQPSAHLGGILKTGGDLRALRAGFRGPGLQTPPCRSTHQMRATLRRG